MEDNPQEYLISSLSNSTDTIEFITHQNHHHYIYFNGVKTDTTMPRNENFYFYKDSDVQSTDYKIEMFEKLGYGESKYNKKRIKGFFKDIIPEYFL